MQPSGLSACLRAHLRFIASFAWQFLSGILFLCIIYLADSCVVLFCSGASLVLALPGGC